MERKVLEKWIENKEDLYIWGTSTASLDMVLSLLRNYEQINIKGIIDNYSKEKYVKVGTNKFQIIEFDKIAKNSKIILCILKRSSYASIREQLVSSGMRYGIDYIEVQPVINRAYSEVIAGSDDNPYDNFGFGSRYSPWRKNGDFQEIYYKCKDNTLVDIYKSYELWSLVFESSKCLEGDLLEVGVWRGGSGALICKAAEYAGIGNKVFLCDTFTGVVKCSEHDNYYKGNEHNDTSVQIVMDLIKQLKISNSEICQGIFPDDMYQLFESKRYRFVHIDVDTYNSAKDIFEFVWKKVVLGGIVVFDDYGHITTKGVTELLDTIEMSIDDGIFCRNMNGHGYFIKIR